MLHAACLPPSPATHLGGCASPAAQADEGRAQTRRRGGGARGQALPSVQARARARAGLMPGRPWRDSSGPPRPCAPPSPTPPATHPYPPVPSGACHCPSARKHHRLPLSLPAAGPAAAAPAASLTHPHPHPHPLPTLAALKTNRLASATRATWRRSWARATPRTAAPTRASSAASCASPPRPRGGACGRGRCCASRPATLSTPHCSR